MRESMALQNAMSRLARFVGEEESALTLAQCLNELEIEGAQTPEDLIRISECLIRRGDVAALVGRTLRARAQQAVEHPPES